LLLQEEEIYGSDKVHVEAFDPPKKTRLSELSGATG
jgi:hypothetical protein